MKVKELMAQLSQVDQDLDVALVYDVSEYWGELYHIAQGARVTSVGINGPKRNGTICLLIE